jgi:hypothetical protein
VSSSKLGLDTEGATGEFLALLKDAKEGTLRKPPLACFSGVMGELMPGISCMGRDDDFGGSVLGEAETGVDGRWRKSGSLFDAQ